MKKLEQKAIILLLLLFVTMVSAQIGIGTNSPHPEAMFEVRSTNKGLLLPRVVLTSTTSVSPFSAHIEGMTIYNTATASDVTPGYYYNDGGKWVRLASGLITDATTTSTGKIQLAGDLAGTATAPSVPGLALKANIASPQFTGNVGVGITTVTPSAALEVASTTAGVLIPRMTSAQRDAIISPANAILIFNTNNNAFEVYKTNCSCWIPIFDSGNTPASNLVNTAPTAGTLNYSGAFLVGQTVTINYIYADTQNDAEGLTSFQWQRATTSTGTGVTDIEGAISPNYTLTSADAGLFIRAVVTPRASSGVLNGVAIAGGYTQVDLASAPFASNIALSGIFSQGSSLTGSYIYTGGTSIESTDPLSPTLYQWQSAATHTGLNITPANLYGATAFGTTYIPQTDLLGRFIRFGVRARDANGAQAANFVFTPWMGPITTAAEQIPVAQNVNYNPNPGVGLTLRGSYSYFDANADPESGTTYQWFTATNANGSNQAPIAGATTRSYVPTNANTGLFIGLGVTPKAATGNTSFGTQVIYYAPSATTGLAAFTFTGITDQLSFFSEGRIMDNQNRLRVQINVTNIGVAVFSTSTVNGYRFSLNNVLLTTTGLQWVTLNAIGIQTRYNAAGDFFTITGTGSSTETQVVTIMNSALGINLTTFSNGMEMFSANSTCQSKVISAGHTLATCSGNLTIGSNSYNLVLINGQCWMGSNLNENSTSPCSSSINLGCNIWTNTNSLDIGSWGYYNTTVVSGSSGWGTTLPAANEGLLYQWSAAMNGSVLERAQGVCPTGWHIPSDCEWMYLEHGLGMSLSLQNTNATWRSTTGEGSKLRAGGTNLSGFTALLVGIRVTGGVFNSRGSSTNLWTSTSANSSTSFRRNLNSGQTGIFRGSLANLEAGSVRCLKD